MAKTRSSVRKREREIEKRRRELKKSQRAADKRERRLTRARRGSSLSSEETNLAVTQDETSPCDSANLEKSGITA